MDLSEATAIRNELVGLAQRRETANYVQSVRHILAQYSNNIPLLDELQLLHITVWLTETGDSLWKELLRIGCSPFAYDFIGDTTLHYAIRAANLPYLQYLHSKVGERIFDVVNNQLCNLMITCCAETPDERSMDVLHCLEWLWLNGVSIEAQDSQGKTALMWAASRNSLTICQWLLSRNAHLAHRDHMNRTALHIACSSGNYDIVLYLCEQGAIALMHADSHDDRRINTPFRIAWQRGHLWLAINMWFWSLNYSLFGKCAFLISPYAWSAFLLILWNLICGEAAFIEMRRIAPLTPSLRRHLFFFNAAMLSTLIFWLSAAKRDPGSVKTRFEVAPKQAYGCSQFADRDLRVFEKSMPPTATLAEYQRLEAQTKRLALQLARVHKETHGIIRGEDKAKIDAIMQNLQDVTDRMSDLRAQVARDRQKLSNSGYYVKRVLYSSASGQPLPRPPALKSGLSVSGICLTCHHTKSIRQHHCSDCGVCVHRFDHHCIWLDNCVGVGNQASFMMFLVSLSIAQIYYGVVAGLYVTERIYGGGVDGRHVAESRLVSRNLLYLLMTPLFYITVVNSLTNILWFCFGNFLLLRTGRSMLTDVTFYESMKRSPHVERRYGRIQPSMFWDFQKLSLMDAILNAIHFCLQDNARDHINYGMNGPSFPLLLSDA